MGLPSELSTGDVTLIALNASAGQTSYLFLRVIVAWWISSATLCGVRTKVGANNRSYWSS